MSDMPREHDEELASFIEASADNPDAWDADDAPESDDRSPRLEAQVSIRLDADHARLLRDLASKEGFRYTAMLRQWIEERLAEEVSSRNNLPDLIVIPEPQHAGEGREDFGDTPFTSAHGRASKTPA